MIGVGELTVAIRVAHLMQLYSNTELEPNYPRETHDELLAWNTNTLPSDEEQRRIRSLIDNAEQDLDILDGEILRVWQEKCDGLRVEDLLRQRQDESARLRIMRIANSPIKRVPPEILGMIFNWYVGGQVVLPPKPTSNPWKLGHVSSHWRQVLWSTLDLWNNLEIALLTAGRGKNVDIIGHLTLTRSALNDVLSRGRGLHNLRILGHSATPVADLIFRFGHRFKSLSIRKASYGVFLSLLELPAGALPFLETIILDIYYDPASLDHVPHTSSLQAAPNLVYVDLSFRPIKAIENEYVDISPPYLPPLPWSQLNQLLLTSVGVPWTVAQCILTECVSLLFCRITISHVSNAIHVSSNVVLTNLEALQLTQVGAVEWDKFLSPFEFPSLRNLEINPGTSCDTVYPMICLEAVTSLVLRSRCHLESFSIGGHMGCTDPLHLPSVTVPDIDEVFKVSPSLRVVEGTLVLPASVLIALKEGRIHLPELHLVMVRLQPDGLGAFVDLLNSLIHFEGTSLSPIYSGTIREATISCQGSPGYETALDAYRKSCRLYQAAGICVLLERISGEGSDIDSE